jgi:hypothetical protein
MPWKLWPTRDVTQRLAEDRTSDKHRAMMKRLLTALCCIVPLAAPVTAQNLSIDEQGARHGQALSAAKICPGARTTAKVAALAASIKDADRAAFDAASQKIVVAWDKAFLCQDVDPAQAPREINSCRKSKILSCTSTWSEIGPEGAALPGLLEFAPQD